MPPSDLEARLLHALQKGLQRRARRASSARPTPASSSTQLRRWR
jgi:hypothetical protein